MKIVKNTFLTISIIVTIIASLFGVFKLVERSSYIATERRVKDYVMKKYGKEINIYEFDFLGSPGPIMVVSFWKDIKFNVYTYPRYNRVSDDYEMRFNQMKAVIDEGQVQVLPSYTGEYDGNAEWRDNEAVEQLVE